jgi:hypothetical protein
LLKNYCREPVVLLFGFGKQLRFCGFASFSHAAMLAYLQLSPPLADMLMQNGELPIVCDFCMVVPGEGEPMVPCACANDTPATSVAMAVKVANVFIVLLLVGLMPACGIPDNEGSGSVFPEPAAIVKNVSNMSAAGSYRPPVQDCHD